MRILTGPPSEAPYSLRMYCCHRVPVLGNDMIQQLNDRGNLLALTFGGYREKLAGKGGLAFDSSCIS